MYDYPKPVGVGSNFCSTWVPADSLFLQVQVVTSNTAKGNWYTLEAATKYEVYGFHVGIYRVFQSGEAQRGIFDIGIGPAGSEIVIASNIATSTDMEGGMHYLPLYIPAGQRVAIRGRTLAASSGPQATIVFNYGNSSVLPTFQVCESLGVNESDAGGPRVVSGNGAFGATVTIATTTKQYKALNIGVGSGYNSTSSYSILVSTMIGGVEIFKRIFGYSGSTAPNMCKVSNFLPVYMDVPSGTVLQAKAWSHTGIPYIHVAYYGYR